MNNIFRQLSKHKIIIFIVLILLLGLFLRVINFKDNLIFAYDQARDAQRIWGIVAQRNLKLLGPETDIPGVFNGPLFYYLLLPVYLLFRFDPNAVSFFLILLNMLAGILLYFTALTLTRNKTIGLLSLFLWMISYEQMNFAHFISNASLMGFSAIVFFFGLALYLFRKNPIGLFLSVVGLAMGIHFNFYLVYLVIFYPVFYFIYHPRIDKKLVLANMILLFVLLSPFLIAEIKYGFMGIHSLAEYFGNQTVLTNIIDSLSAYFQRFSETVYYSFFSFNSFLALFIFGICLFFAVKFEKRKNELLFVIIWTFSTFILFGFHSGVLNGAVANSSFFGGITILIAIGLYHMVSQKKYVLLGSFLIVIFFVSNFRLTQHENFVNIKLFALQALLLKDEKQLIDYTYKQAGGKPFSICALTNPLFINTLWSYLYSWYGNQKYHYTPYWAGQKQYFIDSLIPYDTNHIQARYLIIEPLGGIPEYSKKAMVYLEDQMSTIQDEKKFGSLTVQKRVFTQNPTELTDSQHLTSQELAVVKHVINTDHRYSCFNTY